MSSPYESIARVVKAHGLQGEVAVMPLVDLPLSVCVGARVWFVPPVPGIADRTLSGVRPGPKGPLVAFEPALTIEDARAVAGHSLLVPVSALPEGVLEDAFDPVGAQVVDPEHGGLGTVVDVIVTRANDVWVVHGPRGEVLIPVIDDVILEIDESAGIISVNLLPGLLDEA